MNARVWAVGLCGLALACSEESPSSAGSGVGGAGGQGGTGATGGAGGDASPAGRGGQVDSGTGGTLIVDGGPELEPWLLTIENNSDNEVHRLVKIRLDEGRVGEKLEICADVALPAEVPKANIISSLTFNDNKLYASGKGEDEGDTLLLVNPCTCQASVVGRYGYTYVPGITSTGGQEMFGLTTTDDLLLSIDPATGAARELAPLGADYNTAGLSWSGSARNTLVAINGAADTIVEFDPVSGAPIGEPLVLDYDFGSVGAEYHPGFETLYACSSPGDLLMVDTVTGHVTVGPSLNQPGCNNLAAPYGPVECVSVR